LVPPGTLRPLPTQVELADFAKPGFCFTRQAEQRRGYRAPPAPPPPSLRPVFPEPFFVWAPHVPKSLGVETHFCFHRSRPQKLFQSPPPFRGRPWVTTPSPLLDAGKPTWGHQIICSYRSPRAPNGFFRFPRPRQRFSPVHSSGPFFFFGESGPGKKTSLFSPRGVKCHWGSPNTSPIFTGPKTTNWEIPAPPPGEALILCAP